MILCYRLQETIHFTYPEAENIDFLTNLDLLVESCLMMRVLNISRECGTFLENYGNPSLSFGYYEILVADPISHGFEFPPISIVTVNCPFIDL